MKSNLNRWKFAVIAIVLIAPFLLGGCKHKVVTFPATGEVANWEKSGETRVFDAKNLWQYIDGDSEQYIKAGVVSTSTSDYKYRSQVEAVVDIYTMGDAAGARTILEGNQGGGAKPVQIGDAGVAYAQSVTFRKGPYLVRIVAYQSAPDLPQALMALAHAVEAKL